MHYAQGKTLGGSSAINTMSYLRSTRSAYQRWADLVGDSSYGFESLLPYFKKSIRLTPPNLEKRNAANATPEYDPSAFGKGGPLDVSWNNWVDSTLTWLAKSLQAIGIAVNPKGFSSGELNGGSWLPSTIDPAHATRESSQTSFLDSAIENTDIKVYLHSLATKVIFEGKTAKGVSVDSNGTVYTLSANKEVIVSGGVFNSPKILMLSGEPHILVKDPNAHDTRHRSEREARSFPYSRNIRSSWGRTEPSGPYFDQRGQFCQYSQRAIRHHESAYRA